MSRLSPYRKGANYKPEYAPLSPSYHDNRPSDKYRQASYAPLEHTNKRYYEDDAQPLKLTEKKQQHPHPGEVESAVEKNRALAKENGELYRMLEERGRIIKALEKKLEEQISKEIGTLEAIDYEKKKFMAESQRRSAEYEKKLEAMAAEIYLLNQQHAEQRQDLLQDTFAHEQMRQLNHEQVLQLHYLAKNQASAREVSELERAKARSLLDQRAHEISEMNSEFKHYADRLKAEIHTLNNEIVHLTHMRKIELSEQKLMYENALDALARDHLKQRELTAIENDLHLKRLEKVLTDKCIENAQIGEQRKLGEIEQNVREQELLDKKEKLEQEIQQLEDFHKKATFEETQRLKDLNQNEINALETGNEAILGSLKNENAKLVTLVDAKSQEIAKLYAEIEALRAQHAQETREADDLHQQLRERMRQMERDYSEETERLKIKFAELREADIRSLKDYYEHEIDLLNQQLLEQATVADSNLLHQELRDKNEMRKRFDLEVLQLNSRISELELRLNEQVLQKREDVSVVSSQMEMTSNMLVREAKDRERTTQLNEEEKRRLQQLITAKDNEIEELNRKLALLKEHNAAEVAHKTAEIELVKRSKENVEVELKKEKYFYENEVKKKDLALRNNKEIYEAELDRMKKNHRQEYEQTTQDLTNQTHALEADLARQKALEKTLRNDILSLQQQKNVDLGSKEEELKQEKSRLIEDKKTTEDKLNKYYRLEVERLNAEIGDLKKQLGYK
jgi:hypothetical protein